MAYQGRHDEAVSALEGATSASISGEGWLYAGEVLLERDPEAALDRSTVPSSALCGLATGSSRR